MLGLNDLAKETRARLTPGRAAFAPWLAACVAAARAHGCDVIDGVYNDIKDLDGFRAECQQGLEFGFDGKTLIHPSQIDICNETFAPTAAEIAHAKAVIAAFDRPENHGKGVLQIDGKMVELLHAQMAKRTLAIADAIADAGGVKSPGRDGSEARLESESRHRRGCRGRMSDASLFQYGPDATPYRKLTSEGVRVEKALRPATFLVVEREAIRRLAEAAMIDINHLLRPGHLAQLAKILDDPEATDNDRFVAYDLLKNANIAAGGVLPMCQDTGTAIVDGQEGPARLHRRRRRGGAARRRARRLSEEEPALQPGRAADDVRGEEHRRQSARADRDLRRGRGRLQIPVRRQGRRLRQQDVPLSGDAVDPHARPADGVPEGEDPHARHGRLPALPPGDRHRRHERGADAEDGQARLDPLSRHAADRAATAPAAPSATSRWRRRSTS